MRKDEEEMLLRPIQLPINTPVGAGFERVSEDDPRLRHHPLVIVGSLAVSADAIYRKYMDYRMWHVLERSIESESVHIKDGSDFDDLIQDLFQRCEVEEPKYAQGVDSIGVIYPKADESKVTEWLSKLPPALPLAAGSNEGGGTTIYSRHGQKSAHVRSQNGIKSLPINQQCLDIEVQEPQIFTFINSSADPSWVTVGPEDGPLMYAYASERPTVLTETESSELAAWEKVKSWLERAPVSLQQERQYPEGKNAFPDFRAWINGQEYDIEMTSVPDLEKWTIRGNYRDLEKKIYQVAAQPSEDKEEVVDKLHEVIGNKVRRASASTRLFMLVVYNWSTYGLSDKALWPPGLFGEIDIVFLIEHNVPRCIKWGDWMSD